jgi:3-deoxy-D-manno-octulosonic-acid transferase
MNEYRSERVILVDSVGILMMLYHYAHVAYVGGGFRQGVHNVLEPAAYGVPVLFGPRHRNSHEPLMLVERGGGFVVTNDTELERTLRNLCEDSLARATAGERAAAFVRSHTGATNRVLSHIERHLPAIDHTRSGKDAER